VFATFHWGRANGIKLSTVCFLILPRIGEDSHEVIVNLISNTTTNTGLKIQAALYTGEYPTRIKVSDREMKTLKIERNTFHGNWNYTIIAHQNL